MNFQVFIMLQMASLQLSQIAFFLWSFDLGLFDTRLHAKQILVIY